LAPGATWKLGSIRCGSMAEAVSPRAGKGSTCAVTTPRTRSADHGADFATYAKRKQWRARIFVDGRQLSLGYFATREEASAAHADAARKYGLKLKSK
jgi:hypothetical protein